MPLEPNFIDVHTHVVPEHFPPYLGRVLNAPWPSTEPAQACHRHVMVSGKVYRTISHQCWDCHVRQADMATLGVGAQVLSPMPELLSYWLEPQDGLAMCRYLNDVISEMVARSPQHFYGLGAVPLQDVELSIEELDALLHQRGLRGVEIAGHVNGVPIGDARYRPFFQAAAQWGAAVFVHALRPSGMERLVGPPVLEQALAFPGEVGLAAASLITGGTLAAVPGLRVAFSHGGGTLQALLPRLRHAWNVMPPLQELLAEDPALSAQRLFVDDLVYDEATLRRLIDVFGIHQVMAGSDYPFSIMEADPVQRIAALALPEADAQALRYGNARRWLGLHPESPA